MATILYEQDFFAWTLEQAKLLKSGQLNELDIKNLIEEVETMGRSEKRELDNRMTVLIMHLLKWQFQPNFQGKSWLITLKNQRKALLKVLKDSTSLQRFLENEEWLQEIWTDAVDDAVLETGYTADMFPSAPIWTIEQMLNSEFFPTND